MLHLKSSLAALALAATLPLFAQEAPRPPMVPLTVHNPHFGIWSPSDKLNEGIKGLSTLDPRLSTDIKSRLTVRAATPEEIAAPRNHAFNPSDQNGSVVFPYATATDS